MRARREIGTLLAWGKTAPGSEPAHTSERLVRAMLQTSHESLLRRRRMTVWLTRRRDARMAVAVLCAALALFAGAAAAQPPARSDAVVARADAYASSGGTTAQRIRCKILMCKRDTLGSYTGVNWL